MFPVVLCALSTNAKALALAAPELRRSFPAQLEALCVAHASLLAFLVAAKARPRALADGAAPPPMTAKLNYHGVHFAVLLKRSIADYAGFPYGAHWTVVRAAARNIPPRAACLVQSPLAETLLSGHRRGDEGSSEREHAVVISVTILVLFMLYTPFIYHAGKAIVWMS